MFSGIIINDLFSLTCDIVPAQHNQRWQNGIVSLQKGMKYFIIEAEVGSAGDVIAIDDVVLTINTSCPCEFYQKMSDSTLKLMHIYLYTHITKEIYV